MKANGPWEACKKDKKNVLCVTTTNNTHIKEGISNLIHKLNSQKWEVVYQENED